MLQHMYLNISKIYSDINSYIYVSNMYIKFIKISLMADEIKRIIFLILCKFISSKDWKMGGKLLEKKITEYYLAVHLYANMITRNC